jgi:hypothetical protein
LPTKKLLTRSFKSIDWDKFAIDIANLTLFSAPSRNLDGLVEQYNNGLRSVLDFHAPVRTRSVTLQPVNRWMTTEILAFKMNLRHFERCWRSRQLAIDFEFFPDSSAHLFEDAQGCSVSFFSSEVRQCRGDMRTLYRLVGELMGSTASPSLPTGSSDQEVADDLNQFFCSKVATLTSCFHSVTDSPRRSPGSATSSFVSTHGYDMQLFRIVPVFSEDVAELITSSKTTSCSSSSHSTGEQIRLPSCWPDLSHHQLIHHHCLFSYYLEACCHHSSH